MFYSPRAWVADRAAYRPDDWRHAERWPPPGVMPRRLYLRGDGTLGQTSRAGAPAAIVYDPRRPIPTFGGRNMLIDPGPRSAPGAGHAGLRADLSRRAAEADLTIAGDVRVTLHVESDCPDTDFIAKLIELQPDGSAMLLMDGVMRAMFRDPAAGPPAEPGRVYQVTIGLGDIYHTFQAGSRIEIDVTSSNFPRRARNTNSGNPMLARDGDDAIRIARNAVHHATLTPSFVELPVLET